jgi:hypothetical protein
MGNKIQLALIIVVTILVVTQIYTAVELVRLNSNDHTTTKDCYKYKQQNFSWKHNKYGGKMKFGGKMKSLDAKK